MSTPTFAVARDDDGPRVRYGLAWFALATFGCLLSTFALSLVLAGAAALAADQLIGLRAASSRPLLQEPARLVAVLGGLGLPLVAGAGSHMLTAGLVLVIVLTLAANLGMPSDPPLVAHALPMLAAVPVGLAAAAPVLLSRLGLAAGFALLALVAAYDAGDFIVGTDAATRWEGPAAGVAAVAVVGFALTVVAPPPLGEDGAAALSIVVAMLAPLGPPLASVLIGDGTTAASFVRRLDSLLLAGPVGAYAVAAII